MTQGERNFLYELRPLKTENPPKSCVPVSPVACLSDNNAEKVNKPDEPANSQLKGQELIIYDIIKQCQPVISAKLIGYGLEQYVGCGDKIARNLRSKGLVDSRKIEGKNYVEWFIVC
jgi:hypothetical protein